MFVRHAWLVHHVGEGRSSIVNIRRDGRRETAGAAQPGGSSSIVRIFGGGGSRVDLWPYDVVWGVSRSWVATTRQSYSTDG